MMSEAMKTYLANCRVRANGKLFLPGQEVPLTDEQAKRELEKGSVSDEAPSEAEKPDPDLSEEEQVAALVSAVAQLDKANEDHWTKDGKPDAKALDNLVSFDVSAALRNQAWEQLQAADKE